MKFTRWDGIKTNNGVTAGVCDDCGILIPVGTWPFRCNGQGHLVMQKLAYFGGGMTVDYAPPMPINPIKEPVITRDWCNPDGTMREMKKDEWVKREVPGLL